MAQYGHHDQFVGGKEADHKINQRPHDIFGASNSQFTPRREPPINAGSNHPSSDANHILTNNDSQLMNTFFDDPNNFSMNFSFDVDQTAASRDFSSIFGYPPPPAGENPRDTTYPSNDAQTEGDDMSAASQLVNMAHASPARASATNSQSWNPVDLSGANTQTPDPTRRVSNSFYAPSMQAFNAFASQQQVQARNNVQSARSAGLVEPRHEPLAQHLAHPLELTHGYRPIEQNSTLSYYSNLPQVSAAQNGSQIMFSFGSDSNFGVAGYRNPIHGEEAREKGGNLLGVPLAERLHPNEAQNNNAAMPYEHKTSERAHLNHMSFPVPHSANSSPGGFHGLPFPSSTSALPQNPHAAVNPLKRRNTDIDFGLAAPFGEFPPRKRHHSVVQHVSADEFVEGHNAIRAAQLPLNGESTDNTFTTTFGRPSVTATQRAASVAESPHAASPNSPASEAASPNVSQLASAKKKNRESKSRPNLTESQKRENHIISEQKRRNVIKQAFTDLNNLIPTLQGGKSGLSKAEVLKEVVNYLTGLVDGNKHMETFLAGFGNAELGMGNDNRRVSSAY